MNLSTSPFDIAVYVFALIAVVGGFNAGLLRSLATILGYAVAVPAAIAASPRVTEALASRGFITADKAQWVTLGLLLAVGFLLGVLLRSMVGAMAGHGGFMDRILGAVLGAARVGLLAVLVVLIFERIIPQGMEPWWYSGSQLRPYLAAAGDKGLRSLPPDTLQAIEKFRKERGL